MHITFPLIFWLEGEFKAQRTFWLAVEKENFATYSLLSLSLLSLTPHLIKPGTGNLSKLIKYAVNIPEIKTAKRFSSEGNVPS